MKSIGARKSDAIWELVRNPRHDINKYVPQPYVINDYKATCLCHAISLKDLDMMDACLKRGANPNLGSKWKDEYNEHPMIEAASEGGDVAYQMICRLEAAGATPSAQDVNEMLVEAVWPLSLPCVKWCLSHGADPNYKLSPDSIPALILLCYRWDKEDEDNYITAAALLLRAGANPDTVWESPFSPGPKDWKYHLSHEIFPRDPTTLIERIEKLANSKDESIVGLTQMGVIDKITIPTEL